jgi:hypothetical protein
MRVT